MKTIVWLREDLRLMDNPALCYAAERGQIIPVFVRPKGLGAASHWWLHHSLVQLSDDFARRNVKLILKTGKPESVLPGLAAELGATAVVWNRVYSPTGMLDGQNVRYALREHSLDVKSFNAQLLIEPTEIFNKQGTPFKVFTPFWRHCVSVLDPSPVLDVPNMRATNTEPQSESLDGWRLRPTAPDWSLGIAARWQPGERGAQQRWDTFLSERISKYKQGRDIPGAKSTSMLSPHLAFGEISPKQIWFDVRAAIASRYVDADNGNKFLSEIGWREFSRYLLVHFPTLVDEPFNPKFNRFPWRDNQALLEAWQRGATGYPIVDAGMRELWHTGYMHNRVRMVVASFLTKHLLTDWRKGMAWFWDTLVDADIGNNTASWQWAAGCGADAAPYFRIFNPILQGEKFDPQGVYIRHWVPELAGLDTKHINQPWQANSAALAAAGVRLGKHYPAPIVDHKTARETALVAYQQVRDSA